MESHCTQTRPRTTLAHMLTLASCLTSPLERGFWSSSWPTLLSFYPSVSGQSPFSELSQSLRGMVPVSGPKSAPQCQVRPTAAASGLAPEGSSRIPVTQEFPSPVSFSLIFSSPCPFPSASLHAPRDSRHLDISFLPLLRPRVNIAKCISEIRGHCRVGIERSVCACVCARVNSHGLGIGLVPEREQCFPCPKVQKCLLLSSSKVSEYRSRESTPTPGGSPTPGHTLEQGTASRA